MLTINSFISLSVILNFTGFGISAGLLFFLLYKKTRLQPVTFSWYSGLLYGLPFFPVMLLVLGFAATGSALILDAELVVPALFFTLNSLLLSSAGWLAVQKTLTQTHLILNPFLKSAEIPVTDITDYFFKTTGFVSEVTLLVKTDNGIKRKSFLLPSRYVKLFDQILDQRMKRRLPDPSEILQKVQKLN
ncbi:MAG: hypothetical protein L6Q77_09165 [Bacteroidetes bacterium]|nr:hypothetical protein [Bacteroidota bacterium]